MSFLLTFLQEHWGDVASVLGLIVGLGGFGFTIWFVSKSKTAAEQAQLAAEEVRQRIRAYAASFDIGTALGILAEIKRLQRAKDWRIVLDRFTVLKRFLAEINVQNASLLGKKRRAVITGAIGQFTIIEDAIETSLSRGEPSPADAVKHNRFITEQVDVLTQLLTELNGEMEP